MEIMLSYKKEVCNTLIKNAGKIRDSRGVSLFLVDESNVIKEVTTIPGLSVSGTYGAVFVRKGALFSGCSVCFKNGGAAIFEKSRYKITGVKVYINHSDSIFYIDEDFSCVDCKCYLYEGNDIYIGRDNQWSFDIQIRNSDAHSIIDLTTNQVCNRGQDINIGDHCWLANNVAVLKGGSLENDTIVGAYSVVTKHFSENNIIIAGNPARLIKSNVKWSRQLSSDI